MEKEMWDAYSKQAGGVTFDGKPLPTWDELGEERQACWRAAASVCLEEIEQLRDTLRYIQVQAETRPSGDRLTLSVIERNAAAALNRDFQKAMKEAFAYLKQQENK